MKLAPAVRELPVRFVGSGSEYFRIWIVNLLLTLVTLGLYLPFAKVRRLRYFYGSTEVGGQPLSFHADPWKMFRGFGLVGVLAAVYTVASQASPLAGGVAALAVGGLWPALWRSSLRFRLANTGWSGLRGNFSGSTRDAYLALLPFLLPALLIAGAAALVPEADPHADATLLWLALALWLLALPLGLWTLRRYQHQHYHFGDEQTRFMVRPGAVYRVLALSALIALGVLALPLAALAMAGGLAMGSAGARHVSPFTVAVMIGAFGLSFLLFQTVVRPYATARLQNLFWNGTRSQRLHLVSRLRARALIGLSLKNWLLVVLTLGLYLPFAAVATARLRLQAMALLSKVDVDELRAGAAPAREGAAGDAAGDLFGVDVGL